ATDSYRWMPLKMKRDARSANLNTAWVRRATPGEPLRLAPLARMRIEAAAQRRMSGRRRLCLAHPSTEEYRSPKGASMRPKVTLQRAVRFLAAVVFLAGAAPATAQTQGRERRDARRDDRAAGRAAKQACKAGDEKTRAECRQVKHHTKHNAQQGGAAV